MELPEPNGEKKIFQEKVFIPVQQHPEVRLNSILFISTNACIPLYLISFDPFLLIECIPFR
jgi:hypothetical protein